MSRALDPDVKAQLLDVPGSRELPCIRGRTVVPESCAETLVVGYPNHLGIFDDVEGERAVALTSRWSSLRPVPDAFTAIPLEPQEDRGIAERALDDARQLGKRLRQLKGAQVALRPQSPVIILLLSFSIEANDLTLPGVSGLGDDFPEYAGGIRVEMSIGSAGYGVTRYAAELERIIMEEA